ncbi:hypothetical protein [Nostoc sp. UHCC 0870]|uniref:hypothetical protein n=1 Tax=Nostoc sp. UHCC 0870 TaxID=2914041 RepID=UPI001EDD7AC1|nr:hypothetical protein [Nostoc sp. UHCC 0870]UKO98629.1 hypothetical protein L6494_02505 [Nostoc sp. UHCC 0870]
MTSFKEVVLLDEMISTYRASHLTQFRPGTTALLKSDNESDDLFSMVQSAKKAPGSTSLAVVDTTGLAADELGKPTQNALEIYTDMLTLSSLANVVAMQEVYKEHPQQFDITNPKEASAFITAQTVKLNDTFTRRLGKYAIPSETTGYSFSKNVTQADFHLDFLTTLFDSFNFQKDSIKKLDGILIQVTETLKNLQLKFESETQTLDHLILTNYIEPLEIEGVPEKILVGKIRLFYLKIEYSSWQAVIAKQTVSSFDFKMNYFDTILTINSTLVRGDIEDIKKLIEEFTQNSFDDVKKLTSPTMISK